MVGIHRTSHALKKPCNTKRSRRKTKQKQTNKKREKAMTGLVGKESTSPLAETVTQIQAKKKIFLQYNLN